MRVAAAAIVTLMVALQAGSAAPAPASRTSEADEADAMVSHHWRGGPLRVTLTAVDANNLKVTVDTSGPGCAGTFTGFAKAANRMVATRDPNAPQCKITLTRNGRRMSVQDSPECGLLSGGGCELAGTVNQVD